MISCVELGLRFLCCPREDRLQTDTGLRAEKWFYTLSPGRFVLIDVSKGSGCKYQFITVEHESGKLDFGRLALMVGILAVFGKCRQNSGASLTQLGNIPDGLTGDQCKNAIYDLLDSGCDERATEPLHCVYFVCSIC